MCTCTPNPLPPTYTHTHTHTHTLTHTHKAAVVRVWFLKALRTLGIFFADTSASLPRAPHTIRGFCSRTTYVFKGTDINISKYSFKIKIF